MKVPVIIAAVLAVVLSAVPGNAAVRQYEGGTINGDTTWEGRVEITGPLYVTKGAVLTILPGTVVAFMPSDEDRDGIGDGELHVEGRVVAEGTADKTITFTSGAAEPKMKDWTYIMIELGRDSLFRHCVFEYAFTGLQVHFATAEVSQCLFHNNFEAMRFSTADVTIRENDFAGNVYGIRYESRGSRTVITANVFTANEYAFFPVIKSGPEVRIFANNIESRGYNVKLGVRQSGDLDYGGNWWGTDDPAAIEEGIFDGRREPTLGTVTFEPYLKEAVSAAGRQAGGGGEREK